MKKGIFIKIIVGFIILWLFFLIGRTFYEGWRINQEVAELEKMIAEIRQENNELQRKIIYYQSDAYQDRIARERFGLQKPGEKVVIVVPENEPAVIEEKVEEEVPNYLKWWRYFFPVEQ